ncbi:MAG: hypothetical protein JXQ71_07320 [Verrucomicrobia bacterium]|nr:hypothetical protein [Verrucomicrobiota bacterium]
MAYALLQKDLVKPEVELLMRAFQGVGHFRPIDAQNVAHDAFGIFLRGLDVETASALQDALVREGLGMWVVAETELPAIPPAKVIHQVEFLPHHLTLYDPLRRSHDIAWADVMFLAGGRVRLPNLHRPRGPNSLHTPSAVKAQGRPADALEWHLLLDIVLMDGRSRFSINADEFVFDHLGSRCTPSPKTNLALLVQELVQCAPHAGLNRGAMHLNENAEDVFAYPTKAAFLAEMTWMLWRIGKMCRHEDL